ncbi:hypothetical protein O6P43_001110 [Quillaja saponaria]|uniref:Uncharacterized protein n=1 Tax=Quillaja saponaria TaxID=32244 RepID=A0AAD7QIA2_QUISA|nr:hypothetical protein O6P43_001110 [Quillaja saponaria]
MNFFISFLLILLVSNFLPYCSSFRIRTKFNQLGKASTDHQDTSVIQSDHVQRKALHEVHSGPNPISNSTPKKKWNSRTQTSP